MRQDLQGLEAEVVEDVVVEGLEAEVVEVEVVAVVEDQEGALVSRVNRCLIRGNKLKTLIMNKYFPR